VNFLSRKLWTINSFIFRLPNTACADNCANSGLGIKVERYLRILIAKDALAKSQEATKKLIETFTQSEYLKKKCSLLLITV
jgi:hypothetical protein